jgi:hypothetical protein
VRGRDHEDIEDVFYDCCFLEFEGYAFEGGEREFGGDGRNEYSWCKRGRRGRNNVDLSTHSYS